jgi:pimeloyl-ACP methyl ester carboxylesterase
MFADSTASGDGEYTPEDVGGYRLAIHCVGEGSPTVVLETGLGAPSEYWASVQQEIPGLSRVCRFDRAGRGKSDPPPTTPRTCADMVADLRALLHNAGIPAPYVLVGNSLGGMDARLYAHRHPEEVARLVLVDGSHQEQFTRLSEALPEPEPSSPDSHKDFYHFWAGGGWRDPTNNPESVDFVRSGEQLRAIHSSRGSAGDGARLRGLPTGDAHKAGSRAAVARDMAGSPARAGQPLVQQRLQCRREQRAFHPAGSAGGGGRGYTSGPGQYPPGVGGCATRA